MFKYVDSITFLRKTIKKHKIYISTETEIASGVITMNNSSVLEENRTHKCP